jgi:hypothetical protein
MDAKGRAELANPSQDIHFRFKRRTVFKQCNPGTKK